MILTLTPNPSLDLTYGLDGLARGGVQRAASMTVEAGGKGINVSRNLVANGGASLAVAPVGGPSGEQFLSLLGGLGMDLVCVPVSGAVRMNVSLAEVGGVLTKINASGPSLSDMELDLLLGKTAEAGLDAEWLAVCGSLPPDAPADLYARAVSLGREAGCRVAVDSSGPTLEAAVGAGPDLIKPNHEELADLVGRPLATLGDVLGAAGEVRAEGVGAVLVSLGADGALLVEENGALHADIILGCMMAFDMGGPVNKAAYAFAIAGLAGDAFGPMAAVMAAGMTPPLALALATAVRGRLFTPAERRAGQANWVMGASFITEGAIPFAAADPLRVIPPMMVGSAITASLSLAFGATLRAPHGGIFVVGLIGNWPLYLLAIAIGTIVSAALVIVAKGIGRDEKGEAAAAS